MIALFKNQKSEIYIIPLLLFLLNFIIKVIYLSAQSVALDEPFSIYHAQLDVASIINQLSAGNNPPLFEIILHYWISLFGISEFAVRFLPMVFSCLIVVFIYKTGIKFFNKNIAITASLIFTFSNYHIFYAHETRVYSLFALLTSISMYSFLSLIKDSNSKKHFIILIISNTVLCYAHYFGFFVLFFQFISCLSLKFVRKILLKKYLICLAAVVILYLPYAKILIERFFSNVANGTWVRPSDFENIYLMLKLYTNEPVSAVIFICVLVAALIKFIITKSSNSYPVYSNVILLWFLVPFFLMFIISYKKIPFNLPMFMDRYTIFISIGYFILCALTVDYLFKKKNLKYIASGVLVIAMIATCKFNVDNERPFKKSILAMKEMKTPNSVVYFCPPHFVLNLSYYYNLDYFRKTDKDDVYKNINAALAKENIYGIYNYTEIDTSKIAKADKVIFFDGEADFCYPGNNIYQYLSSQFPKQEIHNKSKTARVVCFTK